VNHFSRRIQDFRIQLSLRLAIIQLHTLDSNLAHYYCPASRKRYYCPYQLPKFHPHSPLIIAMLIIASPFPTCLKHRKTRHSTKPITTICLPCFDKYRERRPSTERSANLCQNFKLSTTNFSEKMG
jgi:hypothetical protein